MQVAWRNSSPLWRSATVFRVVTQTTLLVRRRCSHPAPVPSAPRSRTSHRCCLALQQPPSKKEKKAPHRTAQLSRLVVGMPQRQRPHRTRDTFTSQRVTAATAWTHPPMHQRFKLTRHPRIHFHKVLCGRGVVLLGDTRVLLMPFVNVEHTGYAAMIDGMKELLELHNSDELRFLGQHFGVPDSLSHSDRMTTFHEVVLVTEVRRLWSAVSHHTNPGDDCLALPWQE